jgi:hypothetical protein
MSYEQLQTTGFLFTQTSVAVTLVHAGLGDGFDRGKILDSGLRAWTVKIGALPDSSAQLPLIETKTRANYLWDFFVRSKVAGNRPFWLEDPKDGLLYLASFTEDSLGYDLFCSKLYGTGLALRQRRVRDTSSPILDVNRTPLATGPNKAGGGTSWTLATGQTLLPDETLIVGLAAINAVGWSLGCTFAGNNAGADVFPDGTSPRINLFRFKNRTTISITGDIVLHVGGGNSFTDAYAAFASKFDLITDSPFDTTGHSAGTGTSADSGNTSALSQASELVIGCCGVQGPIGDAAPAIAAGSEANNLGQRAGTTGGAADSNCTIVESYAVVNSTAPANAALTLGVSRAWQASAVGYLLT